MLYLATPCVRPLGQAAATYPSDYPARRDDSTGHQSLSSEKRVGVCRRQGVGPSSCPEASLRPTMNETRRDAPLANRRGFWLHLGAVVTPVPAPAR